MSAPIEVRDATGQTTAERAPPIYGVEPPRPEVELPDELRAVRYGRVMSLMA